MGWERGPGIVELPDGARIRARGLRVGEPPGPSPEWALYLLGRPPGPSAWPGRWLAWPDFWLPLNRDDACSAFDDAHRLAAAGRRIEIACGGGIGRTGTALACIAQLAGVDPADAVGWVRRHFHARAVETPWQRRYARRFTSTTPAPAGRFGGERVAPTVGSQRVHDRRRRQIRCLLG